MMLFDDEEILERVDEYTLYCFYLGFEPQIAWAYHSPVRAQHDEDEIPSWSMFYSRHRYLTFKWKDNARGVTGDIFDLVSIRFGISRVGAYGKVCHDFGLHNDPDMDILPKIKLYEAPPALHKDIRIKSRPTYRPQDLAFYQQFNIRPSILHRYHATSLICYWTLYIKNDGEEQWSNPRFPRGLGFGYRIGERYQIYQPSESKDWKFRTSFREDDVMGLKQLRGRYELLVITKSMKDVMFFDSIGIDAIASHSENRGLPQFVFDEVIPKYKQVVVWFDNDGKESAEKYFPGLTKVYVPVLAGQKDPTDYCKVHGPHEAVRMVKEVLYAAGITPPLTLSA